MTISKDLFLAILAMDSYNRGYAAGVDELGDKGSRLGFAVVGESAETLLAKDNAKTAGFQAVSYFVSDTGTDLDGKTVISYRGTDSFSDDPVKGGNDILQGWVAGVGVQHGQHLNVRSQASICPPPLRPL